jgi:hypothetical protein
MKYTLVVLSMFLIATYFIPVVSAQEVTVTPKQSDYMLPYPGLLPNNPLYFLKALRDDIQGFFISDPVQKAVFDIQESDKHVAASLILSKNPKNVTLAVTTLSKGENYFEDAVGKVALAKKQGINVKESTMHLIQSNEKHQEVIQQIEQTVGKDKQALFENERKRAQELGKKATSIK